MWLVEIALLGKSPTISSAIVMNSMYLVRNASRRMSARAAVRIPGIGIEPVLKLLKEPNEAPSPPSSLRHVEALFNEATCQRLVPGNIRRALPHLERRKLLEDSLHQGRRIVFIDGSSKQLPSTSSLLRVRPQLKAAEKQQTQMSISRCRTRERVYGQILQILHEKVRDPLTRSSVWRITRVQQSADYQYCIIRWTIDNDHDHERYAEPIKASLERSTTIIRYELAKRLSLRIAPLVTFSYEDYSAQRLAETLHDVSDLSSIPSKGSIANDS